METTNQHIFYKEFTNAEKKGTESVKLLFKTVFKNEVKSNYIYLTELAIVLNKKHKEYLTNNTRLSKLYNKLYEDVNEYAVQNLKFGDLDYYFDNVD